MRSKVDHGDRNAIWALSGVAVAGLSLTALGTGMRQDEGLELGGVVGTIGSSLFGSSLAILIARMFAVGILSRIKDFISYLENHIVETSVLKSEEERLKPFRQMWYHYRLTEIDSHSRGGGLANGETKLVWICEKLDLTTMKSGVLAGSVRNDVGSGGDEVYEYEGYIIKNRLLFVEKGTKGSDEVIIHVFHRASLTSKETVLKGVAAATTYTSRDQLRPVMMSRQPIKIDGKEILEQVVVSEGISAGLSEIWSSYHRAGGGILVTLPGIGD